MIKRAWAFLGAVPFLVGLTTLIGWWTRKPEFVQASAAVAPIVFNAALCFLMSGVALILSVYSTKTAQYGQIILGSFIFLIASLTLSQDLFGMDWHIDHLVATSWLITDTSPNPGRMAMDISIAFLLSSLVFILLPFAHKKILGICIEICVFILFLIGILGAAGYLLRIEFLYSVFGYTRMAFSCAFSLVALSVGIWGVWREMPAYANLYDGKEDIKIVLLSSAILLSIVLSVTLACFVGLAKQQSDSVETNFWRLLQSDTALFQNEVLFGIREARALRDNSLFQQVVTGKDNTVGLSVQSMLRLLLAKDFSAAAIYDSTGKQIALSGEFIQQPDLEVKNNITSGVINILWKNGWYLRITLDLEPQNKKRGLLILERPLPAIDKALSENQIIGKTGDIQVCIPALNENVTCYSSRLNAVVTASQRVGNYFLPIHDALVGKSGLITSHDRTYARVFSAYGPIYALWLGIVIKSNVSELYQPIERSLRIFLPVILVAMVVGLLLLRMQVMPLVHRVLSVEKELRRSNKRLEEDESRYTLAAKASNAGLWDWVVGSEKLYCSPYFKSMLGYSEGASEFDRADFIINSFHPDDREKIMALASQHRDIGVPFDTECRMRRKYGDYHWFHIVGQASRDEQGNAVRMAGMITDITERKKADQRLAAQYAVTQVLSGGHNFEETSIKVVEAICENLEWDFGSIWMIDYQVGLMRCVGLWSNPSLQVQAFAMVTRSTEYFIGTGLPGRVWRAAQPVWIYDIAAEKNFPRMPQAQDAGLHSAFCFPILLQNKVLGAVEFLSRQRQSPDEDLLKMMAAIGAQFGQYLQRKLAESALRESESYKTAILESASDSVITITDQGAIVSFNQQTSEMFGYSAEELQKKNIDELLPDLSQKLKQFTGKLVLEVMGSRKNGSTIPAEITLARMLLGKRNMFVCIIRDITERKKLGV